MKCPKCKFVSSNKKDLCSRCGLDLRPHKQVRGIPITDSEASIQDLRRELLAESQKLKALKVGKKTEKKKQKVRKAHVAQVDNSQTKDLETSVLPKKTSWLSRLFRNKSGTQLPEEIEAVEIDKEPLDTDTEAPFEADPVVASSKIRTRIIVNEDDVVANFVSESDDGEASMMAQAQANPSVSMSTEGVVSVESSPSLSSGLDLDALISEMVETPLARYLEEHENFDEEDEAIEAEHSDDEQPLDADPFAAYTSAIQNSLADAKSATAALIDQAFEEEESNSSSTSVQTGVAPEIVEFDDDDDLLEAQLDELIGDMVVDIESVAVEKKNAHWSDAPAENSSFLIDDDMEIDIQIDVDEDGSEDEDSDSSEEAMLSGLIDAFENIEAGTKQKSLAEKINTTAELAIPELPTNASDQDKDRLIAELTNMLRSAYSGGAKQTNEPEASHKLEAAFTEELAQLGANVVTEDIPAVSPLITDSLASDDVEDELAALEAELAGEVSALSEAGLTVYAEPEAEVNSTTETPDSATEIYDDFAALEAELASEVSALSEAGLTVYAEAKTEPESVTETLDSTPTAETTDDLAALEAELAGELDELSKAGLTVYSEPEEESEQSTTPVLEQTSLEAISVDEDLVDDDAELEALLALEAALGQSVTELENELKTEPQQSKEYPSDISKLEAHDIGMTGIFLKEDIDRAMAAVISGLEQQKDTQVEEELVEEPTETDYLVEPEAEQLDLTVQTDEAEVYLEPEAEPESVFEEQAVADSPERLPLPGATETGLFLLGDLQRILEEASASVPDDSPSEATEELESETPTVKSEAQFTSTEEDDVETLVYIPRDIPADILVDTPVVSQLEISGRLKSETRLNLLRVAEPTTSPVIIEHTPETDLEETKKESYETELAGDWSHEEELEDEEWIDDEDPSAGYISPQITDPALNTHCTPTFSVSPALWQNVVQQLDALPPNDNEFEMGLSDVCSLVGNQAIPVLYGVVAEELDSPDGAIYETEINKNDYGAIDVETVSSAIETYQQDLQRVKWRQQKVAEMRINKLADATSEAQLNSAPLKRRLLAAAIDVGITLVLALLLLITISSTARADVLSFSFPMLHWVAYLKWFLVSWVAYSTYNNWINSQTVGQRMMGLIVCDWTGGTVDFWRALLRSLAQTTTVLTFGLGLLTIFEKKGLTLHDRLSRSVVTTLESHFEQK